MEMQDERCPACVRGPRGMQQCDATPSSMDSRLAQVSRRRRVAPTEAAALRPAKPPPPPPAAYAPTHGYEPDVLIFSAGLGGAQWQTLRMTHPVRLRRNPVI